MLARFEAERQALALMDHPNIAKVLDAGATVDGRPFFVMELVKGTPITTFCDANKLSPRQRLELFVPVCQAIQHAHQKGVIHRDIKPSNVLIALYDDKPVPKVIDFGIAKAAGNPLTERTLHTGFGAIVGTPEYMSPEQATFNQLDIDTRSDVYSLGILLYELLTGSTPVDKTRFKEAAILEVLRVVREEEPPRPSVRMSTAQTRASIAATRGTDSDKLAQLLRGELDWIVMKALEKDRNRRYETAVGLARDVDRYLNDELVEARPPSVGYRLRKSIRKNRGPMSAVVLVFLALLGGVIGTTMGMLRANDAEAKAIAAREEADDNKRIAEVLRDKAVKALDKAEANERKAMDEAKNARAVVEFFEEDVMPLLFFSNEKDAKIYWNVLARALPKAEKLAAGFDDQPLVEVRIRQAIILGYGVLEAQKRPDHAALATGLLRNAERNYELIRRVKGDDHEETYDAMKMVGYGHRRLKQFPQAELVFGKILDYYLRKENKNHWGGTAQIAIEGLADVYHQQGKNDQLPALVGRLIEHQRRLHQGKPLELATALDEEGTQNWLQWSGVDIDDGDRLHGIIAEHMLRESLALRQRHSPDDWTTSRTQSLLGASLAKQKRYAEAEPLLVKGYEGLKERNAKIAADQGHPTREAGERLADFYEATGRTDDAKKLRQQFQTKPAEKKS